MHSKLHTFSLNTLAFLACTTPFIALFSGMSLTIFFIIATLCPTIIYIKSSHYKNITSSKLYIIILLFLSYSLISSLWTISYSETLNLWYRITLIAIGAITLYEFTKSLHSTEKHIISKYLLIGFIIALTAANIEILFEGTITKFFRQLQSKPHTYELVDLNRGASYLSIIFWPVLAHLLTQKRWLLSLIITSITIFTLARLESQSAYIANLLSIVATIFIYLIGKKGIQLIKIFVIISIASVAYIALTMNPAQMYKQIPKLENSASEIRLYIWNFTANKAAQKPLFGWGFNSSRVFPVDKSDYVLNNRHPLPLHPHNNVLQIWLELGIIGLIFFALFLWQIITNIQNTPRQKPHCATDPQLQNQTTNKQTYISHLKTLPNNIPIATTMGFITTYFTIGQTGYGIWQNWWLAAGLLAFNFTIITRQT